jgi:histone-lysine N-methyltransferase SETMAR
VPDGRTINAEVYSQQLEKIYTVLLEKCPGLVNRKRVLLQKDNARPHTAKKTLQKIEELEGIELLPHPAFSPDLAPSDYYLFRSMAQFLRGKHFNL